MKSDPYMIVFLENETTSLYAAKFPKIKTKIIEKTLNPLWDEVFHIKVCF
jgi:Ca2+-dependent lipid-binding protein